MIVTMMCGTVAVFLEMGMYVPQVNTSIEQKTEVPTAEQSLKIIFAKTDTSLKTKNEKRKNRYNKTGRRTKTKS